MKLKQAMMSLVLVGGSLALTLSYADQTTGSQTGERTGGQRLTVNGAVISNNLIDLVTETQVAQGQNPGPQLDQQVRNNLVALEAVSQQAVKDGLDKESRVQAQMALTREQILVHALQARYAQTHPIKDDVLHAEYDRLKSALGTREFLAEHILVANESDAKAIIASLQNGASFEKLAKEKSMDTGSRDKGGKLEWAAPGVFDKPFGDALLTLKKGEYTTTPVKTRFGYHVIKLLDERPLEPPPFDAVKDRLRQNADQQAFTQYVQQLVTQAKVTGR